MKPRQMPSRMANQAGGNTDIKTINYEGDNVIITTRIMQSISFDLDSDAIPIGLHVGLFGLSETTSNLPDSYTSAYPLYGTLKKVGPDNKIAATVDREALWEAQTPQVFDVATLREAHAAAEAEGFEGTDDASLVERNGGTVLMTQGPRWNIKVTVPEDLGVVEAMLAEREGEARHD